ncbi:pentatricopeptide repeat-containing protein At2g40720 [Mangifera indica]|uniref:pentatricopeptide repeat-containing protein At2g40720 n=1 Tax=Mangifera indica TaxID=29780 RepID=UPI001CFAB35B|nr:pentatricopeptide repeat-containing protein At2g40720 [Mangifera indica]
MYSSKLLLRAWKNNVDMHFKICISRHLSFSTHSHISTQSLINSKIKFLAQQGQYVEALKLYSNNPNCPFSVTKFTFPSVLKASASLPNLRYGKTIHSTIITMGLQFDPYIASSLINMYVKCASLPLAVHVFDKLSESEVLAQDISVWNSIIDGYFRFGHMIEGIHQFCRMQTLGIRPDAYTLSILLGVCNDGGLGYNEGRQIHGYIVRNIGNGDSFLDTAIINMYLTWGRLEYAWYVFDMLSNKSSVVLWNVMIGGFSEKGLWDCSLELYSLGKNEDVKFASTSFSGALTACGNGENVSFGMQVHCDVVKMGFQSDPYVYTSLLIMYAKCKMIETAEKIFHLIQEKEIEVWNAMISSYTNNGYAYDALEVSKQMRLNAIPYDSFTMMNVLSSSGIIGLYDFGRSVHAELVKRPIQSNIAIQSALMTMYAKCGSYLDAKLVFSTMKERDVVAFGSMISGLCHNSKFEEALDFFRAMDVDVMKPDSNIMVSVMSACSGLENVDLGRQIHGFVIKCGFQLDFFVASSLIDMYSKCGFAELAGNVFSDMPHKNLVVWNSMISCYCRNGMPELSIKLFPEIVQHGFYPDSVSITSVLVAISSTAALIQGKIIHGYLTRLKIPCDVQVENALIDMYIKCGFLKYAEYIFENMSQKDSVTWNSMIAGYGFHGECLKAVELFDQMKRSGVRPDGVTFLSLLSSCNHSGLVKLGLHLFQSMKADYGIEPKMEHFVNIVNLLGRTGCLDDAYSFVKSMPIEPDRSVWLSLLCACRVHHSLELGELAARNLLKLEPNRGSNYVQLVHLYGEAEMWDQAANLRTSMKEKGLKKNPGCSWIEQRNKVDIFFSGDSSSENTIKIYETLNSLRKNMVKNTRDYECVEAY